MFDVYTVRSFCGENTDGNLAGVYLFSENESWLSEAIMQRIAAELNYSETAFVKHIDDQQIELRYFTPKEEVDLCGHATIAAFKLLFDLARIAEGEYLAKTKVGQLKITLINQKVFMQQPLPVVYENTIKQETILRSLNLKPEDLAADWSIQPISTGLKDLFIPIRNIEILREISPDFKQIKQISLEHQLIGYHLFALSKQAEITAYCRNFAPAVNIDEESATGTSSGALASYLFQQNIRPQNLHYQFKQGSSKVGYGFVEAKLAASVDQLSEIQVGGEARLAKKSTIDFE